MPTHKGFTAWMTDTEGNTLPEFNVSINGDCVSCWVPGVEGQNFTVHWSDNGGKINTASYITLDNFTVPGRFLFGQGEASRSGVRVGPSTERPFMFKKADVLGNEKGMVTLHIKRIKLVCAAPPNQVRHPPESSAGGIQVGYGPEKQTNPQSATTWAVAPYSDDEDQETGSTSSRKPRTFVTFVFRYRTYDFLLNQGIMMPHQVPSTYSPSSSTDSILHSPPRPAAPPPTNDIASYYTNGLERKRRLPSTNPPTHPHAQLRRTSWRGHSTAPTTHHSTDELEHIDDEWGRGKNDNEGTVY